MGKLEPTLGVSDALLKLEQELEQIKAEGFVRNENLDIFGLSYHRVIKEKVEGLSLRSVRLSGQPSKSINDNSNTNSQGGNIKPASWGYGANFNLSLVPPQLSALIDKIEGHKYYKIRKGSCRHICVDYYDNSMFREDPGITDANAGGNIFVLSLLSDSVLTLSPDIEGYTKFLSEYPHRYRLPISNLSTMSNTGRTPAIRKDMREVALRSWTDADLDIWARRGHLLHLCDAARNSWKLGIRMGVEGTVEPYIGVCDWLGSVTSLKPRGKRRIQVTLGFE